MDTTGLCEVCGENDLSVVAQSECVPGAVNGLCRCCWEEGAEPVVRLEAHVRAFRDSGNAEALRKARAVRTRTLHHLVEAHGQFVSLAPPGSRD